MSHERLWNDLARAVLLGTARQPPEIPDVEGSLGALLFGLRELPTERTILAACAVLGLHRRAGAKPTLSAHPPIPPAEEDPRPICSTKVTQHLLAMLDGKHGDVLPEWLALVGKAGVRLPHALLPRLMDVAIGHPELQEAITIVTGPRGRWLAGLNPEWGAQQGRTDDIDWDTATRDERLRLLRDLRGRESARARDFVVATWNQEAADVRQEQIELLAVGLSADDEPFLESALDDRSRGVRRIAADLLAQIPTSRLVARMVERARAHVGPRLEVTLPTACDRVMQRDGIEPKPREGIGERAWWLRQIIAAVPLTTWGAPTDAVRAARETEWEALLLESWADAAVRQKDSTWAEALLSSSPKQRTELPAETLIRLVPSERREALFLRWLRSPANAPKVLRLMLQHQAPWSEELTTVTLGVLRAVLAANEKSAGWAVRPFIQRYALVMHLSALNRLVATRPVEPGKIAEWQQTWGKSLATLQFRSEVHAALEPT